MLCEYLKTLKTTHNLTNAQIASMSGISESTISRMMKGDSKGVDLASVLQVVRALGGSMDAACGIMHESENPTIDAIISACKAQIASTHSELNQAYLDNIHSDLLTIQQEKEKAYQETILAKDKWISRLFTICCVLVAALITLCLLSVILPNVC